MAAPHPAVAALDSRKDAIIAAVPQTFRAQLTFDRIRAAVANAIAKNDKLAACSPSSIFMSVLEIIGKGLDIGMDGQAYLVPFKGECTPMIGAQGKIELAYRSGMIERIVVQVLYEHDDFTLDLANGTVDHKLTRDYLVRIARGETRGEMLGAYARIWVKGAGEPMLELMTIDEFQKIVESSKKRSGGRLSPAYQEWPGEMLRRSVLNRALKRAPKSRDLMEVLNREVELEGDDTPPTAFTAQGTQAVAETQAPALPDYGEVENELDQFREPERERVVIEAQPAPVQAPEPTPDLLDREVSIRDEITGLENDLRKTRAPDIAKARKAVGFGPGQIPPSAEESKLIAYRDALVALR